DGNNAQRGVFAVLAKAFFHLSGELPRRSEDQHAHAVSRLAVRRREWRADQILNDGQRKTGSLTGSRLGEADQVPAGKRERNRLLLNRRRMRVAGVADRMEQFG